MGILILVIAFIIETVFAAYCMTTHSSQKQLRSFVRVGAFAAFVLFALVSIIQWSFRWYGLALLLLAWAALGAWALAGRKAKKKDFSAGRTVINAVTTLVLVGIAVTPALIFPQFRFQR